MKNVIRRRLSASLQRKQPRRTVRRRFFGIETLESRRVLAGATPVAETFESGRIAVDTDVEVRIADLVDEFGTDVDDDLTTASLTFGMASIDGVGGFSQSDVGFRYEITNADDGVLFFDTNATIFDTIGPGQGVDVEIEFTVSDGNTSDDGVLTFLVSGSGKLADNVVLTFIGPITTASEAIVFAADDGTQSQLVITTGGVQDVSDTLLTVNNAADPVTAFDDLRQDDTLLIAGAFAQGVGASSTAAVRNFSDALASAFGTNAIATAVATNDSSATTAAGTESDAGSLADNNSSAIAIADADSSSTTNANNNSVTYAEASNSSSSVATSDGNSESTAISEDNSAANSNTRSNSISNATAIDGSAATANASNDSQAFSSATEGSVAESAAHTMGVADADASNTSNATATAFNGSDADSFAENIAQATSYADRESSVTASAENDSSAEATADGGSAASATAEDNSEATALAENGSVATSTATNQSTTDATSNNASIASATADLNSTSMSDSDDGSSATAFATGSSEATATALHTGVANSVATNESDATTEATLTSDATATADREGSATAVADSNSSASADADRQSTSVAVAQDGGIANSTSDNSSTASTDAVDVSNATAESDGGSVASSSAENDSTTSAIATTGSVATANATTASTAESTADNFSSSSATADGQSTSTSDADIQSAASAFATGSSEATANAVDTGIANSVATNDSDATTEATQTSDATATADREGSATATANDTSFSSATADRQSTSVASTDDMGTANANADNGSIAFADAQNDSDSIATADAISVATATASDNSEATAMADGNSISGSTATNQGTAESTSNNSSAASATADDGTIAEANATQNSSSTAVSKFAQVDGINATGTANNAIDVQTGLTQNVVQGQPAVLPFTFDESNGELDFVELSGFPNGTQLSEGQTTDNGVTWRFVEPPTNDIVMTLPASFSGSFLVDVRTQNTDDTTALAQYEIDVEPVQATQLTINNTRVIESDSGVRQAQLTIKRSDNQNDVSVLARTIDNSATAGEDYEYKRQEITFAAGGELTQTFTVDIFGDTDVENDERIVVRLFRPRGAEIADATGIIRIVNDDAQPALLTINNTRVIESDSGVRQAELTITRSHNLDDASVLARTIDNSATAGEDFEYTREEITFAAGGELTKTFTVDIFGDADVEDDERIVVRLFRPRGIEIDDATGIIKIVNDDVAPVEGRLIVQPLVVGQNTLILTGEEPGAFSAFTMGTSEGSTTFDDYGVTVDVDNAAVPVIGVADENGNATVVIELTAEQLSGPLFFQAFGMAPASPVSNLVRGRLAEDVNGDSAVTALDALLVINNIQSNDGPEGEYVESTGNVHDVNGDGRVTALDALRVINHLGRDSQQIAISPQEDEDEDDDLLQTLAKDEGRLF